MGSWKRRSVTMQKVADANRVLEIVWEIAVHLAVACGVYGDVFLCCPFSHEVSWMRS